MADDFVLLLQEVAYHPRSYLTKLDSKFETPSIVRVTRADELRKYSGAPMFDDKYLVIFDDLRVFDNNKAFLSFKTMFPVLHLETATQIDDAMFLCKESKIPYRVFNNKFTEDDAVDLIISQASEAVSDTLIKTIIRQVGLNPLRIIVAIGVCEQMGYKASVVTKYVDKWLYPDLRKIIAWLLGVPQSRVAKRNALQYLHTNRYWYKYIQRNLLDEVSTLLEIFRDKISGELYSENIFNYIEEKHITRARVMFGLQLFDRVSIASVLALREYLKNATLMDVVLKLS